MGLGVILRGIKHELSRKGEDMVGKVWVGCGGGKVWVRE